MHIIVPYQRLEAATLKALLEEFVTRDGSVQGHADTTLSAQADAVLTQLRRGRCVIVFNDDDQSYTICPVEQRPGTQAGDGRRDITPDPTQEDP